MNPRDAVNVLLVFKTNLFSRLSMPPYDFVRFPLNYHISTGREPMVPKLMRFQRAFLVLYGDYATPISAESDSATGEPTGTRTPIAGLRGRLPMPVRRWTHI